MAFVRLLVLIGLLLASACARGSAPTATPARAGCEEDVQRATVGVAFGEHCVHAEVAATPRDRQDGLMHRPSMPEDSGMIFLFPERHTGGFWMKDTLIPLSIAYMESAGAGRFRVLRIMDMDPCRTEDCPSYAPGVAYDAALEVNQGWFAERDVGPGATAVVRGRLPTPS